MVLPAWALFGVIRATLSSVMSMAEGIGFMWTSLRRRRLGDESLTSSVWMSRLDVSVESGIHSEV